jgi:HEAT repeat protein
MHAGQGSFAIAELIERLAHPEQIIRVHAATLLGTLGEDAAPAVPALVTLLKTGDVSDRKLAALTLGEIGPAAAYAVGPLLDASGDEDEDVGDMAAWALEQIDLIDDVADEAA